MKNIDKFIKITQLAGLEAIGNKYIYQIFQNYSPYIVNDGCFVYKVFDVYRLCNAFGSWLQYLYCIELLQANINILVKFEACSKNKKIHIILCTFTFWIWTINYNISIHFLLRTIYVIKDIVMSDFIKLIKLDEHEKIIINTKDETIIWWRTLTRIQECISFA